MYEVKFMVGRVIRVMIELSFIVALILFNGCKKKSCNNYNEHSVKIPRVIRAPRLKARVPTIEKAQQLVVKFPKSGYAYYLLGCAYYERKEYTKAVSAFEKALRLDPALIDAYYALAYSYDILGKWDHRKIVWRKLLQLPPPTKEDVYAAYIGLGNVALDQHGKTKDIRLLSEAEKAYQRALKVIPQKANAYYGLGIVFARRQQWDKAKELFEKAFLLSSTPRDKAKSLEALANVWLEKGDRERAKRLIQQAREMDPNYPATLFAR